MASSAIGGRGTYRFFPSCSRNCREEVTVEVFTGFCPKDKGGAAVKVLGRTLQVSETRTDMVELECRGSGDVQGTSHRGHAVPLTA